MIPLCFPSKVLTWELDPRGEGTQDPLSTWIGLSSPRPSESVVWFYLAFSGRAEGATTPRQFAAKFLSPQMTLFRPALAGQGDFQGASQKFAPWGKSQVDFEDPISLRGN